jgi:homoserine O-acetyltransferase
MSFAGTAATVDFEIVGPEGAPVILALGGISADRHVCGGWWSGIAGPGRALDSETHRVLGIDYLDGGRGADGRPARVVTTHDQGDAIAAVLDAIDVACLHAIVGASYGGMVALAFAERYPERLERLVVIGAAHRPHPMATARRIIQRRVVELGLGTGRPREALAIARELATTTYRSDVEFERRFASGDVDGIAGYLRHQGDRFARRFAPERFLALSLSSDLHAVAPARIRAPATLVAAQHDAVVPRTQLAELASELGAPGRLVDLPSMHGHDAFLTDTDPLGVILRDALAGALS